MELYDFNRIKQRQRTTLVLKYGEFLASRVNGNYTVCLYYMGIFFAEIWYHVEANEIQVVRGFKSMACLEPYLNMVDLSDISS